MDLRRDCTTPSLTAARTDNLVAVTDHFQFIYCLAGERPATIRAHMKLSMSMRWYSGMPETKRRTLKCQEAVYVDTREVGALPAGCRVMWDSSSVHVGPCRKLVTGHPLSVFLSGHQSYRWFTSSTDICCHTCQSHTAPDHHPVTGVNRKLGIKEATIVNKQN